MPEVNINGPGGRLEGRYMPGKSPKAPLAIMLHPHPQYGGTMNNRVVYALYQSFVERGFSTLRFNFRGVGRSEGKYDRGEGELSDAAAALDWLQSYNPEAPFCWIGGFSFGAWIGMQLLMRRPEITGFLSIAPPANTFDFSFLAPCPTSGLMVQGGADQLVPPTAVKELIVKLTAQKSITIDYRQIRGADHFFSRHLNEMVKAVDGYLDSRLPEEFARLAAS